MLSDAAKRSTEISAPCAAPQLASCHAAGSSNIFRAAGRLSARGGKPSVPL